MAVVVTKNAAASAPADHMARVEGTIMPGVMRRMNFHRKIFLGCIGERSR